MEHKYKLLIVDNDNNILNKYENYLIGQGFIVETAHNGTEGLDKLSHDSDFDVALINFKMPDMNGIDMIRQAYKMGVEADTILWSNPEEYDKYDAIEAMKLGVNDWFEKSHLDLPRFFKRIKEIAEGVPLAEMAKLLSSISTEQLR